MIPTMALNTTHLKLAYNCDLAAFRFDIGGRGSTHVERDKAVAAALSILGIANVFGGLSGTERERLNQIVDTE